MLVTVVLLTRPVGVTVSRPVGGVLSTGPLRDSGCVAIHLCGPPGSVNGRTALSLFGLAPDGVYLADRITPVAGALLPHRFTLTCARCTSRREGTGPSAVCFLWHFPAGRPDWPLASILSSGAPTFLSVADHAAATRPAHRPLQSGAKVGSYPAKRNPAQARRLVTGD